MTDSCQIFSSHIKFKFKHILPEVVSFRLWEATGFVYMNVKQPCVTALSLGSMNVDRPVLWQPLTDAGGGGCRALWLDGFRTAPWLLTWCLSKVLSLKHTFRVANCKLFYLFECLQTRGWWSKDYLADRCSSEEDWQQGSLVMLSL